MTDVMDDAGVSGGGSNVERVPSGSDRSQLTIAEQASRRASIASAVSSIQKFKESWMSIMFLKASVGLGQVIVLVTLLILASLLDSPLAPFNKQAVPSDACPRPALFQSWMIVQIFRLVLCWSVSCWVALRQHRASRNAQRMQDSDQEARLPSSAAPCTPGGQGSMPSLTHSASSYTSNITLVNLPPSTPDHNATSPGCSYPPTVHSRSSASIELLASARQHSVVQYNKPARFYGIPSNTQSHDVAPINLNLDLARANHRGEEVEGPAPLGVADRLEAIAPKVTKCLGGFSFILFILGNVLLFYPLPSEQQTCYHASPMLWWGVMAVTGVGWFLFGQIILVVLVIGVGGPAILNLLRRLPFFPAPPTPEPPRPPQPAPLTFAELSKVQVVCYVPDPESADDPEAEIQPATPARSWDFSRFPYTPHLLKPDQATCAICQDNFTEPETIRRLLYQADPLRLLNCGHVYHKSCIDKWLTGTSGICPSCNQGVREPLPSTNKDKETCEKEDRRWYRSRSRAPASSAALASATA